MKRMADIHPSERPREKLRAKGVKSLSDQELLAILIGMGNAKYDVMTLAEKVLKCLDSNSNEPDLEQLQAIEGIGLAKAALITAAIEFSRRRIRPEGTMVRFTADLLPMLSNYSDRKQEHLLSVSLNGAHEVIAIRVVTIGLTDKTMIHPREVFADPITDRASAIILAHNHPSGLPNPSPEDVVMTKKIYEAGITLGIKLLDHVIFNSRGYFSMKEKGMLDNTK
jgi:DNA repair protein RadC